MCVVRCNSMNDPRPKDLRKKRLRLKRGIRYKLIAIIGCTLLLLSVIFTADILFVEYEKSRHFGLSDKPAYDYQTLSDVINSWFDLETQNGALRTLRQETENGSVSEMNMTAENDPIVHQQFPPDVFTLQQKRMGAIILHIIGIIYMFIALALVCDEFFVPSLEIIIEKLHIPEDVAGATFMAAGGSAPEFFTSLVGVFFARNAVGFGTIVGSAVFNILFVIGVVGLLAKNTLQLTWWPLFRDTFFYTVALGTLIGFFQNGQIEWYESLVLFILYILYVLFMFINSPTERFSKKYVNKLKDKLFCCRCSCNKSSRVHSLPDSANENGRSASSHHSRNRGLLGSTVLVVQPMNSSTANSHGRTSGTHQSAGKHRHPRISSANDPNFTDHEADVKTNGSLYPAIQETISSPKTETQNFYLPPLEKEKVANSNNGGIIFLDLPTLKHRSYSIDSGFRSSCTGSEIDSPQSNDASTSRISSHRSSIITNVFVKQDTVYPEEVESIVSLEENTAAAVDSKALEMRRRSRESRHSNEMAASESSLDSVSTRNDDEAPSSSMQMGEEEEEEEAVDDDDEGIVHIIPPKTWLKRVAYVFLLPLIILLFFTLPDIKKQRWRCFFPYVFVGSVLWIGVFSYFMVWWATVFGDTANIPPSVMGLTFLAAGTSIPDLITSVIVARKGFGDMALSSSIGSNMFDVTVGLPIPWLLFSATHSGQAISVISNGLFCSVLLLVGMLLVMLISISIFQWKLGKLLGLVYLVMYIVFVTLSILLELVIHCTIGG